MIHQVLSVFDMKARAFAAPFYVPAVLVGVRSFTAACRDPESLLFKFPGDYALFHLGSFDDLVGVFSQLPQPENLGLAANFVEDKA